MSAKWKKSLLGCFGDISLSIVACAIMPVTVARQVEYTGSKQGTAWIIAMATNPCCAGPILRGAIREKEGIDGSFFCDCVSWIFCPPCSLIQEARQTGVMDDLLPPELQSIDRKVESATEVVAVQEPIV